MTWTGERCDFDMIEEYPWVYTNHLLRYSIATQYCFNKDVLDIACGTGYGMYMISSVCNSICGGDICKESLMFVHNEYKFFKDDLRCIDLNEETILEVFKHKFDVVISFETIEHLNDPNFFIRNVYDALTDDGLFIFSVPIRNNGEFHKILFTYDNALKVGDDLFKSQRIIIQRFDMLLEKEWVDSMMYKKIVFTSMDILGVSLIKIMEKRRLQ